MEYEDDSRDFAEIGEVSDVQQITLREAMQWIAKGVGFGVVHADRWTPVDRFCIMDREPTPAGLKKLPQQYVLKDCYGTDIPTTEGSSGATIAVFVWSNPA